MAHLQLNELAAFAAVAECLSFTKAAAQLNVALPTVSQTIRSLEERLEVRLFNRTTRSVALTEAGERLLAEVRPILDGVDQALESINLFREKPIGTLRLAVSRAFAVRVLVPLIQPFLEEYPAIRLELSIDDTNSDIVRNRFDAGIRLGNMLERDMKIVRVMDDFKLVAVAAPQYLARHAAPSDPRELRSHNCVRYRMPGEGSIIPWTFTMGRKRIETMVDGSLIVNDLDVLLSVTLDGVGVGYLPEAIAEPYLLKGQLVRLLPTWDYLFPGIFLYHPSRRQTPMPLAVFLKFIQKWRKTVRSVSHPN